MRHGDSAVGRGMQARSSPENSGVCGPRGGWSRRANFGQTSLGSVPRASWSQMPGGPPGMWFGAQGAAVLAPQGGRRVERWTTCRHSVAVGPRSGSSTLTGTVRSTPQPVAATSWRGTSCCKTHGCDRGAWLHGGASDQRQETILLSRYPGAVMTPSGGSKQNSG